jgi:hypothetical protein
MTQTRQNFEVYAGDDKEVTITVYQEDETTLLNLTSYTLNWVLYDADGDILLTKIIASGLTVPTPSNGQVVVSLVPADTLTLDPGVYSHELEITSVGGKISTVTTGLVKITNSEA